MSEDIDLDTQEEVAQEVVETVEETKSMDDTIRETLAAIEQRGEEESTESRQRDDKGRFSANPETVEPVAEEPAEITDQPEAVEAKPTVPPELQRLGLRKDEAEAIAKDPAVLQAFIRRSEEMHKGLEIYREKAQLGDMMEKAISPYMATIQAIGTTPDVAVQKLFSADHALRYGTPQQKLNMLATIARDYGVDMGQFQQYQAEQPYVDPQVYTLQQQLQQLQGWVQQRSMQEQEREQAELNSEISRFASDPSNSYYEQVRDEMARQLRAGLATDLKDAYERAIYANPTVRTQILAKQQAEAEAKRKADAAQKAQEAKRAAAANVTRRGSMPAAKPVGSMDDTIRAEAERLGLI